jgi:hypothetical protein
VAIDLAVSARPVIGPVVSFDAVTGDFAFSAGGNFYMANMDTRRLKYRVPGGYLFHYASTDCSGTPFVWLEGSVMQSASALCQQGGNGAGTCVGPYVWAAFQNGFNARSFVDASGACQAENVTNGAMAVMPGISSAVAPWVVQQ